MTPEPVPDHPGGRLPATGAGGLGPVAAGAGLSPAVGGGALLFARNRLRRRGR
ncbi:MULTISPECIES: hypothetical protein [Kitasatospora]|uniref:Uncharacterized protein n=1 Tax=Kitasatospora setae (strain ATCC 33774 / DSM 43861 / JCM 3304 / KCC A-0304 / NBRC 14216 / KM-6054) TaxID=452652 RepID=E4N219_KITSK|nr:MULTISPECIES: hypothetical protein [Kitasatospora]BAJ32203.1 hypothetical protein KSE_64440 [Kitasatospora setae KM-6054]